MQQHKKTLFKNNFNESVRESKFLVVLLVCAWYKLFADFAISQNLNHIMPTKIQNQTKNMGYPENKVLGSVVSVCLI